MLLPSRVTTYNILYPVYTCIFYKGIVNYRVSYTVMYMYDSHATKSAVLHVRVLSTESDKRISPSVHSDYIAPLLKTHDLLIFLLNPFASSLVVNK